MFESIKKKGFQVSALHHAEAILIHDMEDAVEELESVLVAVSVPIEELVYNGGREEEPIQQIKYTLSETFDWEGCVFETRRISEGLEMESVPREIHLLKEFSGGTIALEFEWSNKNPLHDRYLENFKRLHADGVISVGGIITRGESFQDGIRKALEIFAKKNNIDSLRKLEKYYHTTPGQKAIIDYATKSEGSFERGWAHAFANQNFGNTASHWRLLLDMAQRGAGRPCPLVLIGIPAGTVAC